MSISIFIVHRMYTYVNFNLSVKTIKNFTNILDIITPGAWCCFINASNKVPLHESNSRWWFHQFEEIGRVLKQTRAERLKTADDVVENIRQSWFLSPRKLFCHHSLQLQVQKLSPWRVTTMTSVACIHNQTCTTS
jgi:hypothetical protein